MTKCCLKSQAVSTSEPFGGDGTHWRVASRRASRWWETPEESGILKATFGDLFRIVLFSMVFGCYHFFSFSNSKSLRVSAICWLSCDFNQQRIAALWEISIVIFFFPMRAWRHTWFISSLPLCCRWQIVKRSSWWCSIFDSSHFQHPLFGKRANCEGAFWMRNCERRNRTS